MKMRLKYVVEDMDRHGNVRRYFRKPGSPKIRLHGMPGTPEFSEAYAAALHGLTPLPGKAVRKPKPASSSFSWLCVEYFSSAEFKQLDARTQLLRRRELDRLCELDGDKPFRAIEPGHIRKMRDAKADKPESANSLVKTLRQLFSFACHYSYASYNPARDVPYIKSKGDGFHTWTEAEVSKFEARHPINSQARLAMALMLYLGQRRSDAIRLGPQHIRDGRMEFKQHKNRVRNPVVMSITIHPDLQKVIDANPTRGLLFIVNQRGEGFTDAGFGNKFRKWCDQAGLFHCGAHGLRKAAATRLAEAGCTELEIMSITGHRSSKQVSGYTRAASRMAMSGTAITKWVAGGKANKSVPLSEAVEIGGTNSSTKALKS